KPGWSFNPETREIFHQARKDDVPLPVGVVPPVLGRITWRMANRMHTKLSVLLLDDEGHRRVVSMSALLDGTWADVLGQPRPVGADAPQAFAQVMRDEVLAAPEMPAVPVKDKDGGILLPEADSQTSGYLRLGDPDEVASAALLLASGTATYVNGAEWFIDGGYTSGW
ncbi:SDR family oxidoreductase, partial [Kitasatospora cinereorecta]|uniref:SDR family oxidoreductase n=1 Tax=Kitasatospora cinereorecta TaxID=285560 RepID=UPI0031F970AC